jgi:RNA polymerase sigma factor for flagellar operon FliA
MSRTTARATASRATESSAAGPRLKLVPKGATAPQASAKGLAKDETRAGSTARTASAGGAAAKSAARSSPADKSAAKLPARASAKPAAGKPGRNAESARATIQVNSKVAAKAVANPIAVIGPSGRSTEKPAAKSVAKPSPRASASNESPASASITAKGTTMTLSKGPAKSTTLAAAVKAARPAKSLPVSLAERPIEDVWREYRAAPSEAIRNFLMQKYLELVRFTAERLHMKLPSEVELDDLMSAGLFGLMDAINAFDLDRGVKFETYCTQRIRGAIFDELRMMDWVPRLVRSRTAKMEKVRRAFEMENGRRPTADEVAQRMGIANAEFDKVRKDSHPVGVVSLNRKWFETDSSKDVREIDVIRDTKQEDPFRLIQRNDVKGLITKGLTRAERLIVVLYYYEEMTMKEIGTTLDLSESRVSQMHSSILARLKAQLQHRERDI